MAEENPEEPEKQETARSAHEGQVETKEFDPISFSNDVTDGFTVMLCAQRRTGKTVLVTDLVARMQKVRTWKEVLLFSETANSQRDAFPFVPEQNRIDHLDLGKLDELFKSQEQKKQLFTAGSLKAPHRVLVIADDVINSKAARDKGTFNRLFTQGRHFYIDVFSISQTVKGFHPMARSNADLVVMWRSVKLDDRQSICEDYLLIEDGPKRECMRKALSIMNKISQVQYQAMVIAVYKGPYARRTNDYVYHYKADPKAKAKMIGKGSTRRTPSVEHKHKYKDKKGKERVQHLRTRVGKKKKRRSGKRLE